MAVRAGTKPSFASPAREALPLLLLLGITGAALVGLGVRRVLGLNALWLDLGYMVQAVASAARGEPLVVSDYWRVRNFSYLGEHGELALYLFAPFFRVFPSPLTLVVLQNLLVVSGGWAFYRLGRRWKGPTFGLVAAALYLWMPVAQAAALFDVHGDTLAMAFLAWALESALAGRTRRYAFWLLLALASRMYVAVPVFLMAWPLRHRQPRLALMTALLAAGWFLAVFVGLRWWLLPEGTTWWEATQEYLRIRYEIAIPDEPQDLLWRRRLLTLWMVLVPWLPAWWARSPWLLPALSIVLPAYLTPQGFWYCYHHYAIAVPFMAMGTLHGLDRLPERLARSAARGLVAASVALTLVGVWFLCNGHWSTRPFGSASVQRLRLLLPWLQAQVDPDEPLVISPNWAPFLAARPVAYPTFGMFRTLDEPVDIPRMARQVDAFVVDVFFETDAGAQPDIERDVVAWLLDSPAFGLQAARDGLLVFRKGLPPEDWMALETEAPRGDAGTRLAPGLYLLEARLAEAVYQDGTWQLRFAYRWWLEGLETRGMYALTWLEGYPASRALHLGPFARPLPSGPVVVVETVPLTLPHRPGCYPLQVAWFRTALGAPAGAPRNRVGAVVTWGAWRMEGEGSGTWQPACTPQERGHEG